MLAQSTNNLKDIGLGFHAFQGANRRLPFNGTVPAQAGDSKSGSWAFQILPFVDQADLFFRPNTATGVPTYMCPGRGRPLVSTTGAWTDYFINPWLNNFDGRPDAPDAKHTVFVIADGTSNTILVGQGSVDPAFYSVGIAFPQSTDIFKGGNPATTRTLIGNHVDMVNDARLDWGGPFSNGALMCMCDATIRLFPYEITENVLAAFLQPYDGKLNLPDT